jgi:hypothetical protein
MRSRDSAVGVATGNGLDGRGVGVGVSVWVRFLSSLRRPDRFRGPPFFFFFFNGVPTHIGPWPPLYEVP